MKKIVPLSLLIIIGCILVAGCFTQKIKNTEVEKSISPTPTSSINVTIPSGIMGLLNVSIGDYPAKLPVFIDNMSAGDVSQGKPLSLNISEGRHTVKVCAGEVCEQVDVEINSAIKTSIDFEERLKKNVPQGWLNVSIGNLNAELPVFIDDTRVGNISLGKPLNLMVREGRHTVKVCAGEVCETEDVEIKPPNPTSLDIEERLKMIVPFGPLSVSIGGYDAELPVFIDDTRVGVVSPGKPLNLMIREGRHTVRVCVGMVCENESVEIKFAKQSSVDFWERLKRDVEFPIPTVRILNSFQTGTTLYVDVEFINPDMTSHTMSTSIRCVYSYIDDISKARKNDFALGQISTFVKAGERKTQRSSIYLSGGVNVIATEPVLFDVSTN